MVAYSFLQLRFLFPIKRITIANVIVIVKLIAGVNPLLALADLGDTRDAHTVQFFPIFKQFSAKIMQTNRLAPPGKSWIRHCLGDQATSNLCGPRPATIMSVPILYFLALSYQTPFLN